MAKRINENKQADKLDKLLPIMSDKEVANKLNIPLTTVRSHAANRKIKKTYSEWSKEDLKTLKKEYPFGIAWVMDKLPNRSKWAIINKYREVMGLRPEK